MADVEIWRPIARFDNIIEASNYGALRRQSYVVRQGRGRGHLRTVPALNKLLERRHPWGYIWVEFSLYGVRHWEFRHRLVAEAFLGECPAGYYVLHGDNVPGNDGIENLRYGTPSENCADKLVHGTQPSDIDLSWSKLRPDQVVTIRNLREGGATYDEIARSTGLTAPYVWRVCSGQKYKHVAGPLADKKRKLRRMTAADVSQALNLKGRGLTLHQIAGELGFSRTQIQRKLAEAK